MSGKRKRDSKDWFTLTSLVIATAGLLWAIVSHFIPSAALAPGRELESPVTTNATANGPGSVAVMSGGQVTNNFMPLDERASSKMSSPRQ